MADVAYELEADMEDEGAEDMRPDPRIFRAALSGENIAGLLSEEQIGDLAMKSMDGFDIDAESMREWEEKNEKGMDLARMLATEKTYPWPQAANAKYPLIAQAAMQFNARVYPAIVPSDSPVQVKVWGEDPTGAKAKRASRVKEFMGLQLSVSRWEEDIDRLTLMLPIVGNIFRKVTHDPIRGMTARNCGRIVINNHCTDLDQMGRISEEFELYPDKIIGRIRSGRFIDFDWRAFAGISTGEKRPYSKDEGTTYGGNDEYAPQEFIEQHCRHDFDDDGYPEPYVVTIHKPSRKVVRVVGNFDPEGISAGPDGRIFNISPREYYVTYNFLPPMDNTFLGIGLGYLLGNTSELVNSIINQILDSGHLASLGGGFIGTGLNLKGGPLRLRPGEYKPIQASGSKINEALVPLTFPGPSPVLFQMLGLLIEGARDVAATTEVMTGDMPREQPATTTMALIEQGMAVFNAAYKRLYRALRKEFALMMRINAETVSPEVYNKLQDADQPVDPRADFSMADMDVQPVADPAAVTSMQRMGKAQLLMELAGSGIVDQREAILRVLEAAGIEDREKVVPAPDPQVVALAGAQQQMLEALQTSLLEADLTKKHAEIGKLMSETEENRAQAIKEIADAMSAHENQRVEHMIRVLDIVTRAQEAQAKRMQSETGRPGRMAGKPRDAGSAGQPAGAGV